MIHPSRRRFAARPDPGMNTIVFLPGLDGTGALFRPLLDKLSPAIRQQLVSYPSTERLGYQALTRRVVSALPRSGDYLLLGESFSGPVAIAAAAQASHPPRGLVLACSFASAPRPMLAPFRHLTGIAPSPRLFLGPLGYFLMGRYATPALRQALAEALSSVAPAVLRHRASEALSVDVSATLARSDCPVLYLQATEDRVIPERCAVGIQRLSAHARVVRIAGPHFLLQTQPAAAAAAIESFFGQVANAA